MVNQEHLDILRKGVGVWNQWRKEHTDIRPNLSGARLFMSNLDRVNLSFANLTGANLGSTQLYKADLSGANLLITKLDGANLWEANLSGANLTGTNLSRANLSRANLSSTKSRVANIRDAEADIRNANLVNTNIWIVGLREGHLLRVDLSKADLNGANLIGADLSFANLREANLNGANLSSANLREADLRETNGLPIETIITPNFAKTNFTRANLSKAILEEANFSEAIFEEANLSNARLSAANLHLANVRGARLSQALLHRTDLRNADLSGADLRNANLSGAELRNADLSGANLSGADLSWACFIHTNLRQAKLSDCLVYGIAAWDVDLANAVQSNLVITPKTLSNLTVDNLEVAQFIYLLLSHQKIRQTIDTITSQVVLILGSFPPERKGVIDTLSKELRSHKYSPVVFNFEETDNEDFTATARTLVNMARFVLIDLTNLDDAVREIAGAIVPHCVVPIRPLLYIGSHQQQYELFRELQHKHRWVLAPYRYKDLPDLHANFQEKILLPITEKMIELKQKKLLKMFIGYAREDKSILIKLKTHLRLLERTGLIDLWDDQDVAPGEEKGKEIERYLSAAQIILLLISPDFLISHDCYDIQMNMAMERHEQGKARVIPIILRPCAWQSTPLKKLQSLPKDGKPISKHNKDDIFFEVSEDIGSMIKILG